MVHEEVLSMADDWEHELKGSVNSLRQRNLLRAQRPTLPQLSSVEVRLVVIIL